MKRTLFLLAAQSTILICNLAALDNGLAKTPPMGWNSWNKFGCKVREDLVRKAADSMVQSGMKDAGYQYIVIDDCWQVSRDKDGNIVADPATFPSGIKALADYVHARGLKFGIYSDAGPKTCAGRPASLGHEMQDAKQYAAWGVDYLKYDWCHMDNQNAPAAYSLMRDALKQSGRPIVFSICEWGSNRPWTWAPDVGNLWRTTGDITDKWEGKGEKFGAGVMDIVDLQAPIGYAAGPGHWNDPDMLEVGNGGLTTVENQAHFSLWAILAAPLMAGNDLDAMTPEVHDILTNKEVIAVDQDPLGHEGVRVRHQDNQDVWVKPLQNGAVAVVLLNRGTELQTFGVKWEEIGLKPGQKAAVRDLWAHKNVGEFKESFSAHIAPHQAMMVTLTP
jgi:alpha-galactosidase